MPFSQDFYFQPTLKVAEQLLGQHLVYESPQGLLIGEINEVESYIGIEDPACHGARGKDLRNAVLFGPGGCAYIYFTYGMYYCLNAVTGIADSPSGILIRSIIPIQGIEVMIKNRHKGKTKSIPDKELTNGPGKICLAYRLTIAQNGLPLTKPPLYIEPSGKKISNFERTPRIGISKAIEKPWRFYYSPTNSCQ